MPAILEEPILYLLSRLNSGGRRWIIGMAGLPGSGKTTLAARLAEEVNAHSGPGVMVALGMDGFHLTKAQLRQLPDPEEAFARRGAPWTFDAEALLQRLIRLSDAAGRETVAWPGFQHDVGDPIEGAYIVSPETRLILIEGLYLLCESDGWGQISQRFDERWYLDTPFDVAMDRLTQRHMQAWGWARDAALDRIATNDRLNAEVVFASRNHADWWVRS